LVRTLPSDILSGRDTTSETEEGNVIWLCSWRCRSS